MGEVVLETSDVALSLPGLEVDVAERDAVGGAGQQLGVRQGDAADVVGEFGPADGLVIGAADDPVFRKVVVEIEAREEAEEFFLRSVAAVDEGELERAEGVGGTADDGDRCAGGIFEDDARGVTLEVTRGVVEHALGVDVGLFGADAGGDF